MVMVQQSGPERTVRMHLLNGPSILNQRSLLVGPLKDSAFEVEDLLKARLL